MKIIQPKHKSDVPWFVLLYWFVITIIIMLYTYLTFIPALTPDHKFIERTDCLVEGHSNKCLKYSQSYYVPLKSELYSVFIQAGIITGVVCAGVGLLIVSKKKK
ncbi:MAG TPA: hypothetical protein VHE53_04305 [Patescibacteria group bacterium]|nr:hypothetical protein [Patescibacteria group bacterium]